MADEGTSATVTDGLLPVDEFNIENDRSEDTPSSNVYRLLYTSHFLSTWNARIFEFGAFLFLAQIYPQTLLQASIYALIRGAGVALSWPWLGAYLDGANRLQAIRVSIIGQRVPVALSCIGLYLMVRMPQFQERTALSIVWFSALCLLAVIEKLSSTLNTISVERDWVVVVANGREERLALLNAQMRRIDLFCKLVGPLVIALVDGFSSKLAILLTGSLTAASVLVEYFTIASVFHAVPGLNVRRTRSRESDATTSLWTKARASLSSTVRYVNHSAFLPSFSLALLYLTVLSFAGQFVTFVLALGLSSSTVGTLRAISAVFELSATWIAPKMVKHIGVVRAGIWCLNVEIICVGVACAILWSDLPPTAAALGTVGAVMFSRVGLWGFDLCSQQIIQEEVEAEIRGTFSSQEMALQNIFEMLAFASTIAYPRPQQFKYPATLSAAAVALAGVLYTVFVRARRGHLVHMSSCIDRKGQDHQHWYSRLWHGHDANGYELEEVLSNTDMDLGATPR